MEEQTPTMGTIICPLCGGSGETSHYDENDYTVWTTCPACEGSGRITGELIEDD